MTVKCVNLKMVLKRVEELGREKKNLRVQETKEPLTVFGLNDFRPFMQDSRKVTDL